MAQALQYLDDNGNPVKPVKPLAQAPGKVYLNPETGEPLAANQATATAVASAPDLTTNTIDPATGKGYGLYRMAPPGNSQKAGESVEINVPYNRVRDAQAAGYSLHPDDAPKYQKDSTNEGKGPSTYGRVASLLTRMTEPMPDTPLTGSAWNQANAAVGNVEKLPFNVVNRTLRGVAGLPQGMAQTEAGLWHGDPAALESLDPATMGENAYRGLNEDTASLGPMAALGNLGGDAATMYVTGKLGGKATELGGRTVEGVGNVAESGVRRLAGSGPGVARELVRKFADENSKIDTANAKAVKDHLTDTQSALHEQQGREIGYQRDVANKAQEIDQTDRSEAAQLARQRQAAEQKVTESNEAVKAKHQAVVKKVADANRAAENALELRRQREQTYKQSTDAHYAKEAADDTRAKTEENSAWSKWRQKIAGKTMDGGQIADQLKSIAAISPETVKLLRQLQVAPEDAPLDSLYAQDRSAIMKTQGYTGNYFDYPERVRANIDQIATSSGFEPDPIDFDPQAGKPIPVEQVHRASSILQRYIRSGRFEGPLLGEMKQVAKVLRAAVTRASADAGAGDDLGAARASTITYQEAFGRESHSPDTARTIREKQLNPEAFQERADEERLAKARNYDPTLVDSYRQVKAARKALDSLPPEEQLRKSLKQVPPPPTVNDPRPGFRLAAPPQRAPARLASGAPAERAFQSVDQPQRPNFPDRPVPDPHQTISEADLRRANETSVQRRGSGAVGTLVRLSVIWPAFHMLSDLMRGREVSPGGLTAIPAAGAAGAAIDEILAHPQVKEFLLRPSRQQIAQIPLELRGDMPKIVATAKARGIQVSPLLAAYAAAIQRNQAGQSQAMQPTQAQGATQ